MPSLKDFPFSVSFVLLCVSVLTSVPGFNALTAVTPAAIVPIPKNAAKDALIAFSLALCATPFIILCFSSGVNFLFNFFSLISICFFASSLVNFIKKLLLLLIFFSSHLILQ